MNEDYAVVVTEEMGDLKTTIKFKTVEDYLLVEGAKDSARQDNTEWFVGSPQSFDDFLDSLNYTIKGE